MRTRFGFPMALVLLATLPTFAQKPGEGRPGEGAHEQGQHGHEEHGPNTPRANQGHVPAPPPQREVHARAEALITVAASLEAAIGPAVVNARGLPGYTFERAAGELWRSRFDAERNLIVVNNGHRDFVFATRNRALQLRYLVRLYVKELVLRNFAGLPAAQLVERMVELSLYVEEKLKPP